MSFTLTHLAGFGGRSRGVTVTQAAGKKTDGVEHSSSGSRTFSAFDFDAAASNRQIFAGIQVNDNAGTPTLSSVTIGAVSATLIARSSLNGSARIELWAANVPTGTSGDVVITPSETVAGLGCCLWIVTGAQLASSATSEDVDDSDPQTGSVTCPAGGAIFAVNGCRSGTGYGGVWSGVTDNAHAAYAAGSNRWGAGAAQAFANEQSSLAVSYNQSGSALADVSTLWVAVAPA